LQFAPETRRGWELLLAHGAVGAIEPTWRLESRVHRSVPGRDSRSPQPKTHLCILSRVVFCFTCFKMFFFDLSKGKFNFLKTTEQEKAEGNFENLLKNLAFAVVL